MILKPFEFMYNLNPLHVIMIFVYSWRTIFEVIFKILLHLFQVTEINPLKPDSLESEFRSPIPTTFSVPTSLQYVHSQNIETLTPMSQVLTDYGDIMARSVFR